MAFRPFATGSHVFFDDKNRGDNRELFGKVHITVVLIDNFDSMWNTADIEELKLSQAAATATLEAEAQSYGVSLSIEMDYIRSRTVETIDLDNFSEFVPITLKMAGLPEKEQVSEYIKKKFCADEGVVFFALNYGGRSFALPSVTDRGFEYTVLYKGDGDYRHELLHLFGAADYYFPDAISRVAKKYFPDSVMLGEAEKTRVDDLTAYLVGWTDRLSPSAAAFIKETDWITHDYLDKAGKEEIKTGFAVTRFGEATYTGELVGGSPHGKGRIVWDNGNEYEGEWVNGSANGYGVMKWNTIGESYSGYWKNWKMHGTGTYISADKSRLSGEWRDNKFVG